MKNYFIILLIILSLLVGCNSEEQGETPSPKSSSVLAKPALLPGCKNCHTGVALDSNHSFPCIQCHRGNNAVADKNQAHQGLIAQPAHPSTMAQTCGSCHSHEVQQAQTGSHFTLRNKINKIRTHLGAQDELETLTAIPVADNITTVLELGDDMLRRRCLRCHVYTSGDPYPYVSRGTGCAACHLSFSETKLVSHTFIKPTDQNCLSCHYGNYVGSDYYGKFENDYNWEYRTPYATRNPFLRPYGVEQLNLAPDIHQQKGLVCIDCHPMSGHSKQKKVQCTTCHQWNPGMPIPSSLKLQQSGAALILTGKVSGKQHPVPKLQNPAHAQYSKKMDCQVCHGQWSFNDQTTHLFRSESEEYDIWERLTVQGSAEVQTLLEHNLYSDEDEYPLAMRDGITGELRSGIWYKGFTQRRWENMIINKDIDGKIKVFRPLLDLRLSMVTEDDELIFDNEKGVGNGLLPYTPHTTGKAGMYYRDRFRHLLHDNKIK